MSHIQTENLTVGYGKKPLLADICIKAQPGEVVTLIGPNGAGKSTILKTLIKQLAPIKGTVYLKGKNINDLSEKEIARNLSVVLTGRLHPELLTAREVVATGRYPYTGRLGILAKEDWDKVDEAIRLVHAEETQDHFYQQLSDGQKQRVLLARAICQDTEVMVLDEPTSFLDIRYKLDILESIRRLAREKNKTVIMSLHELDLARMISDVIVCVDGEKIKKIGPPEEIFHETVIGQLYHIEEASFDSATGALYMKRITEAPKGFVIGGGRESLKMYSYLVRRKIPFATGVLWENDVAYGMAKATASQLLWQKAYYPIGDKLLNEAKKLLLSCEWCVCPDTEFGPYNGENKVLYELAKEQKKLRSEDAVWQK